MRTESNHEQPRRDTRDEVDTFTNPQRIFAEVVGRALAEAWRRKWRNPSEAVDTLAEQTAEPTERGD